MLRFVSCLCLCLATAPALADTNLYSNPTVGLRISKPESWQFVSAQQNLENLRRTELKDSEFHQAMLKHANAPLVVMMKYPEPYEDLNPSLKISVRPMGQLKGVDPKELVSVLLQNFKQVFKDFEVLQPPMDTELAGLSGAYMEVSYSLVVPEVGEYPTLSQLWILPRGDYFFMVGAGTRVDEQTGTRQEIAGILQSLSIDP